MPTPSQILAGLTAIANDAMLAAVAWHVLVAAVLVLLARGWRPSRRLATALLAVPLASVSAFAFAFGNPFNGVVFAAATVALAALAARVSRARVAPGARWASALGLAMIAFAWVYPHFLEARSPAMYLVAAPVGLIPCPTVSLVVGFALLANGLDRRVAGLLGGLGAFYAVFGLARLGVTLDLGLLAGAAGLGVLVIETVLGRRMLRHS